jgi:hypothetical protein
MRPSGTHNYLSEEGFSTDEVMLGEVALPQAPWTGLPKNNPGIRGIIGL